MRRPSNNLTMQRYKFNLILLTLLLLGTTWLVLDRAVSAENESTASDLFLPLVLNHFSNFELRDSKFGIASNEALISISDASYFGPHCMNWRARSYTINCRLHTPYISDNEPYDMGNALNNVPPDYDGIIYWLNEPNRPNQADMEPCDAVTWKIELEEYWPDASFIGPNIIVDSLDWLQAYYECHHDIRGFYPPSGSIALHFYAYETDYSRDWERKEAVIEYVRQFNDGVRPNVHYTEFGLAKYVPIEDREAVATELRERVYNDDTVKRVFFYSRSPQSEDPRFLSLFDNDDRMTPVGCGFKITTVPHPDCD